MTINELKQLRESGDKVEFKPGFCPFHKEYTERTIG